MSVFMSYLRNANRAADALRPVTITRQFTVHAEGSVLIEFGQTRVLCTASVEERVPPHKKGSGEGTRKPGAGNTDQFKAEKMEMIAFQKFLNSFY